jgi:transcriptional regulator GlxA family with amidase domain
MTVRSVAILVFDGVTMLDAAGPAEVLCHVTGPELGYEITAVSASGGEVRTSTGLPLGGTTAISAVEHRAFDTVVVAGGDRLVGRPIERPLLDAAAALTSRAGRIASVCTGAFVLAELGLLDGRRATTHWRHVQTLARGYPRVEVEPDAIFVRDGKVITSAGISAGVDLALAMVEHDHGPAAARDVARELVVFLQRPGGQSQFSVATSTPVPHHPVLRRLLDEVSANPAADHTVPSMARLAGVSTRHLTRLFGEEVGTTPGRWVERIRLELAQQLLLQDWSVTAAAQRSGLGSDETLRRVFDRHLGITPSEYRRRFRSTDGALASAG